MSESAEFPPDPDSGQELDAGPPVDGRWLRIAVALAAFLPILALSHHAFAFPIGLIWWLAAVYFWPMSLVTSVLGIEMFSEAGWSSLYQLAMWLYCFVVAIVVDRFFILPSIRREPLSKRRFLKVLAVVWGLPLLTFGFRASHYAGLWTRPCPTQIDLLDGRCDGLDAFRVFPVHGFIDRVYVARFQDRGVIDQLVRDGELDVLDAECLFRDLDEHQRAGWWRPPEGENVLYYASPHFPIFGGRGRDGPQYLLAKDPSTSEVHLLFLDNF